MKTLFSLFIILFSILGTVAISRKGIMAKVFGYLFLLFSIILTCASDYNLVSFLAIGLLFGVACLFLLKIKFRHQRTTFKWTIPMVVFSVVNVILFACLPFFAFYKQINLLFIISLVLVVCSFLLLIIIVRNIKKTNN